jgi:hypothetical protein|tara:strand:+ start:1023 stop:1148 length:126 start_codon:yes stop_codon:yes gene_type:complete
MRANERGKSLVMNKVSNITAFESSLSPLQCAYIQQLKGALI